MNLRTVRRLKQPDHGGVWQPCLSTQQVADHAEAIGKADSAAGDTNLHGYPTISIWPVSCESLPSLDVGETQPTPSTPPPAPQRRYSNQSDGSRSQFNSGTHRQWTPRAGRDRSHQDAAATTANMSTHRRCPVITSPAPALIDVEWRIPSIPRQTHRPAKDQEKVPEDPYEHSVEHQRRGRRNKSSEEQTGDQRGSTPPLGMFVSFMWLTSDETGGNNASSRQAFRC